MAITTINLTDPVSTLITKTNAISTNLGDAATLFTSDNTVDAINSLQPFSDSDKIIAIARSGLAEGTGINYDSSNGLIAVAGTDFVTEAMMANDAIGQNELKSVVNLQILDSAGVVIKTIYGAGA